MYSSTCFEMCARCSQARSRQWKRGALSGLILLAATCLSAQTPSTNTPNASPSSQKAPAAAHARHHRAARPAAAKTEAAAAPAAPAQPPAPKWPVNDKPVPAEVTWDSHGLGIHAANSSLEQILGEVSAATGTKVVGLAHDERVFGIYGPGPARDVLSQLLQGSGYNIVMVGGEGSGAPLQILLTARSGSTGRAGAAMAQNNSISSEEDSEPEPETPQPPAVPANPAPQGFAPANGAPQSPPQILQQIRDRQQQQILQQQPVPPSQNQ
jgi:hypothetical protein